MKTTKFVFMMQGLLINCVRSPYLSGASSSYAELNNTFTFMCTVSDSSRNTDEVRFQRETHEIALLKQMTSRCVVVNITQPEHYSASCGPGTSSVLSRSKTYTLTIKKVSLEDNTKWFCETNNPHRRSQSFKFRFKVHGTWSSWGIRFGPCQADCKRLVFLSRTCKQSGIAQDKIVICNGTREKHYLDMCPVERCLKVRTSGFQPTVIAMLVVTIVMVLLLVVVACVCQCPRPGLPEEQAQAADFSRSRQQSIESILQIYTQITSPSEIYHKYCHVPSPPKTAMTHVRQEVTECTALPLHTTTYWQQRMTDSLNKSVKLSPATKRLIKKRNREARVQSKRTKRLPERNEYNSSSCSSTSESDSFI